MKSTLSPFERAKISLLATIVVALVILRLTNLDNNPPGFFVDESSTAQNAFLILTTGQDEHGKLFPTYFKAFGEFKNPIFIYSQIPSIAVLGESIEAARLPAAMWGLLAAIFLFLIFRKQRFPLTSQLFGVSILLISPWHFILSRIAFEVIALPAFLFASLFTLLNKKFFLFASITGLGFYAYTSSRLLAPTLLVLAMFLNRKALSLKGILVSFLIFSLTLVPAVIWELQNPGTLTKRLDDTTVISSSANLQSNAQILASKFLLHLSPSFLLSSGDNIIRHSLGWHSVFLWSTFPLLILGLLVLIKSRNSPFSKLLLLFLPISLIPSVITYDSPHILRLSTFLSLCILTIGLGANFLEQKSKLLLTVFIILFVVEAFFSLNHFQNKYKFVARDASMPKLSKKYFPQQKKGKPIISGQAILGAPKQLSNIWAQKNKT